MELVLRLILTHTAVIFSYLPPNNVTTFPAMHLLLFSVKWGKQWSHYDTIPSSHENTRERLNFLKVGKSSSSLLSLPLCRPMHRGPAERWHHNS